MFCGKRVLVFSAAKNGLRCNRSLFTDESLGLVSFDTFRRQRRESWTITKDQLWHRLERTLPQPVADEPIKRQLVFSEDLLQAIAVVDTKDDTKRLFQSVEPFVKERTDGGDYRMLKRTVKPFSPLLMKLFHRLRDHESAFRALMPHEDKALDEFFGSNLQCYQIGMDLLFEARQYQKVLDSWNVYEKRRSSGESSFSSLPAFPRSLQVLVLAACYKMNTPESFQYATKFIESGYEYSATIGDQQQRAPISFTRKALAMASALALNQNQPELSFELLSLIGHDVADSYTAPRTLKCILLAKLSRWPEVVGLFKRILESDLPSQAYQDREISIDAVRVVEASMGSIGDKELKERLKRVGSLLRKGGHIIDISLDDLLCAPVQILHPSVFGKDVVPLLGDQKAIGPGSGSVFASVPAPIGDDGNLKEIGDQERNIWETSSVYDDDSSAMASLEKFQASERKLRAMDKRKTRILKTVGKWIREEGPLELDDKVPR